MILVLFIFQEVLFRIIFPIPEISNFNRINYSPLFFSNNTDEPKYLSNSSFIWASDPDKAESLINLNIYGFRGEDFEIEAKEGDKRVVFIGDSFTEGYLAADNETIPVAFQNELNAKGKPYEVLNLGIGGTDFNNYMKLMGAQLPLLKPDHAIIVMHGNDLPPNPFIPDYFEKIPEYKYNSPFVPRAIKVISDYFADKTVPRIWRSEPFIFFESVPAPSNPWSNPEKTDKYANLLRKDIIESMKIGRFNPFAYDEYSMLLQRLPQEFKISEHLGALQNFTEQFGKKVYLVYIPAKNQVSDYYNKYFKEFSSDTSVVSLMGENYQIHAEILRKNCQSLGIPFFDCTELIKEQENTGNHLYWEYDAHFRPKGYMFIGKEIYKWWNEAKNQ